MPTPSLLTTYAPLLAALTVCVGWIINNRQANNREKRKEIRDDIKEIEKKIAEILVISKKTIDFSISELDRKIHVHDLNRGLLDLDLLKDHIYNRKIKKKSIIFKNIIDKEHENFFDLISGDFINKESISEDDRQSFISTTHRQSTVLVYQLKSLFLSEFD